MSWNNAQVTARLFVNITAFFAKALSVEKENHVWTYFNLINDYAEKTILRIMYFDKSLKLKLVVVFIFVIEFT